jgi:hypothetical protein
LLRRADDLHLFGAARSGGQIDDHRTHGIRRCVDEG